MIKELNGRYVDDIGRVVMTVDGLTNLVMQEKSINGLLAEECDDTINYNKLSTNVLVLYSEKMADESLDDYDLKATSTWKTPKEYQIDDEDLISWLFEQCTNDEQYERVLLELNMYSERNLYQLLKHLIFLVDHFREKGIVWGVGRGSSVSSYVLFLIGIHRVDSLKFGLNIKDFLK